MEIGCILLEYAPFISTSSSTPLIIYTKSLGRRQVYLRGEGGQHGCSFLYRLGIVDVGSGLSLRGRGKCNLASSVLYSGKIRSLRCIQIKTSLTKRGIKWFITIYGCGKWALKVQNSADFPSVCALKTHGYRWLEYT